MGYGAVYYGRNLLTFWENSLSLCLFSMEAANSFKAAVNCYRIGWHHTPEYSIPDGYCCENLKCDSCVDVLTHKQYKGGAAALSSIKSTCWAWERTPKMSS